MLGWLKRVFAGKPKAEADADPDVDADADVDPDVDADADAVTAIAGEELDLHTFSPKEVADVVTEYVQWAAEEGLVTVRIIHGKGKGVLRRIVHSTLEKHPCVASFVLGGERSGNWGATVVTLRQPPTTEGDSLSKPE